MRFRFFSRFAMAALVICALAGQALALDIVLSNDDGLSSNVVALYNALKANGHDVIVSVPCNNQSGMGGAITFFTPLTPLATACKNGAASAGDPGAGKMTKAGFTNGDYFYVNGTPIMSMLYGIDVQARARWGKAPDLVLSGPNEGQNVGSIVNSSGTIGNVQNAASRGIPAIALSADTNTTDNNTLANPNSAKVANLAITLINALKTKARSGALLPQGMCLNVNFPTDLTNPEWAFSRIGTYDSYEVTFVNNLGADPVAAAYGLAGYNYPGISVAMNTATPTREQAEDEAIVSKTKIAVTAMQVAYDQPLAGQLWLRVRLHDLFTGAAF